MGNQLAHESGPGRPTRTFGRTGALGLSKADLDKRCKPSGLYPNCHWDEKAIRRLIGDGRLAARLKGSESRSAVGDHECPICFLHYSEVNRTQCCRANICTECFLQIRPQKEKNCVCPFCNNPRLFVSVARRLNNEQLESRQADEQRVIESRIRRRVEEQQSPEQAPAEESPIEIGTSGRPGLASSSENNNDSRMNDVQLLRQLSLTSQDRAALEQEMRAQHTHPLALQVEAEEEQRRIQNEIEYHRNNSSRARMLGQNGGLRGRFSRMTSEPALMSSMGRSGRRNWNDMVEAFERSGGGDVNSLDDLVVLEAAILLSMEEDARRRGEPNSTDTNETSNSVSHHAREGFPMVQERLSSSRAGDSSGDTLTSSMGSRMVPMASPRTRFRRPERSVSAAPPTTLLDSASLLLRGVTEDEQVAMAIALSMQEDNKDAKENGGQKGESDEGDDNNGGVDENNGSSNKNNNDEEENTNTAHEEDGDNSDSTPDAEATSPEACGVAALPESALPQTAFAKMPSNRGIDDDDDYDDDEVGIKLPALRVAGAKTTGDDEVVEKGPRLEDGQVSMPMEQPVMVVEEDEESGFVARTES